jgi:hypothetical protein
MSTMGLAVFFLIVTAVSSTPAPAQPADGLCVRNASAHRHLFAVEAPGTVRRVAPLAPGGTLCVTGADPGSTGRVWVYEDAEAFEGCGRLVPVGRTEDMRKYVEFDRCFWSSNS